MPGDLPSLITGNLPLVAAGGDTDLEQRWDDRANMLRAFGLGPPQGLLCRVFEGSVASPYGYHLLLPQRKRRLRLVRHFVDWVHGELKAQTA